MAYNQEGLPSLKRDLQNSKLFLQQCGASGDSLYDHLSNVISKVIDERPKNVVDYFELFSERVRLETFRMNENLLEEGYKEPERLGIAQKLLPKLIEKSKRTIGDIVKEPFESTEGDEGDVIYHKAPSRDLCELQFYWNLLGIGFPREEVFLLTCSIERLKSNPSIASCRFWGKMLGIKNDYYIVESTLTQSALKTRSDAIETTINIKSSETSGEKAESIATIPGSLKTNSNTKVENNDEKDNGSDLREEVNGYPAGWNFSMKVAESQYRPPVEIPAEKNGHGVNRHVYYVCTDLEDDWTQLPPATPHQINVTRRIKKYLTGNLDKSITSYPAFPGTERNYLRCLIARVSAATHISPRSFYKLDSSEEEEEDDFDDSENDDDDDASLNNDKRISENESYRPWPICKLLKLDYWEHHKPEILKQGRVSYFDGSSMLNENDDESEVSSDVSEEEDEAETSNNEGEPEIPIPLFASCSGDRLTNDAMSPWTIRLSDVCETLVSVKSLAWPGAFAFVKDRTCDNIYIGYGHKYSSTNYAPPAIPQLSAEYPIGSDVIEDDDEAGDEKAALETQGLEVDSDSTDEDEVDKK